MIQESGIYNCFTKNHIPIVFFNKSQNISSFDVTPTHSPYPCLFASGNASQAPDTIPMKSYVIEPPGQKTLEFKREIDFLSSLGLCAIEETDNGPKYHIHIFAEIFYGPNKLFRSFTRSLSTKTAAPIFQDLRQLLYRYVLPGKHLSYNGQKNDTKPVELTYIKYAIDELKVQLNNQRQK